MVTVPTTKALIARPLVFSVDGAGCGAAGVLT